MTTCILTTDNMHTADDCTLHNHEPEETIWLLTIEHRHGTDSWAFRSEGSAEAKLLRYVEEWWDELPGEDAFSDFPEATQAIGHYFGNIEDEHYTLAEVVVED